MSSYLKLIKRKRKWTPQACNKGELRAGSEDSIFRALALRCLELPVKELLQQGLEKDLPEYKKFFAETELKTESRITETEKKVEEKISDAVKLIDENYEKNIEEVDWTEKNR